MGPNRLEKPKGYPEITLDYALQHGKLLENGIRIRYVYAVVKTRSHE